MKIFAGVLAASALLVLAPAVEAQNKGGGPKGVPNTYGYVPHQKTGGNHPGGHSSVYGHKKNAPGGGSYYSGGGSGGGHVHGPGCGHPCSSCKPPEKKKQVYRCFPPGHCKSINEGYYGPPGQRGR